MQKNAPLASFWAFIAAITLFNTALSSKLSPQTDDQRMDSSSFQRSLEGFGKWLPLYANSSQGWSCSMRPNLGSKISTSSVWMRIPRV